MDITVETLANEVEAFRGTAEEIFPYGESDDSLLLAFAELEDRARRLLQEANVLVSKAPDLLPDQLTSAYEVIHRCSEQLRSVVIPRSRAVDDVNSVANRLMSEYLQVHQLNIVADKLRSARERRMELRPDAVTREPTASDESQHRANTPQRSEPAVAQQIIQRSTDDLATEYQRLYIQHEAGARGWFRGLIGASVVAAVMAIALASFAASGDPTLPEAIARGSVAVFVLGLAVYFVRVCSNRYAINVRLAEVARSKAAALRTLPRFAGVTEDPPTYDSLVQLVAAFAFAAPPVHDDAMAMQHVTALERILDVAAKRLAK